MFQGENVVAGERILIQANIGAIDRLADHLAKFLQILDRKIWRERNAVRGCWCMTGRGQKSEEGKQRFHRRRTVPGMGCGLVKPGPGPPMERVLLEAALVTAIGCGGQLPPLLM